MFKNYFKTAIRQLARNRLFSILNILGLAAGLCGSILIFLWVQDELSYDRQNPQPEDVFRLIAQFKDDQSATTPAGVAPYLQRTLPQVKQFVRFWPADPQTISFGEKRFIEKRIWYADSNFQQLFNFPLVKGDPGHVLRDHNELFITESAAKKYFGDKDPMGQHLSIQGNTGMVVTGVLKDLPVNSHVQFDFLLPLSNVDESDLKNNPWNNFIYYTYLRLDHSTASNPAAVAALEKNLGAIYRKEGDPRITPGFGLQRLTDIHLGEHYVMDVPGGGSLQYVRIFALVAVFILLIACINFMNLSTALSGRRAKEVGLRKTIGAMRWQLVAQFLGEAVLLSLVAFGVGMVLVWLLLPLFNELTDKHFSIQTLSGSRFLLLLSIAIVSGLLAGSYPALVLSKFQPVKVLKGLKVLQPGKAYFRNGLVVLQFTIAIALMVGTLVVYRQLRFIRERDMGFDKSNLLYVSMPQVGFDNMKRGAIQIDAALAGQPGIIAHTAVGDLPTYLTDGDADLKWPGKIPGDQTVFPMLGSDENTLDVFGMHLLTGRTFSKTYGNDSASILVNEQALQVMHMNPARAVGQRLEYDGVVYTIIGVVRNFNTKPVQYHVDPLLLLYHFSHGYDYVVVKTAPGAMKQAIETLRKQFATVYPQAVFEYGFVDKDLDALYASEEQMGKLFNGFSVLAILISCLGLFGLSAYTTQRRIKEIGVRKVLGASVQGIVGLLAREFLVPVAVATLIAFPLAAWGMDKWLHAFVYRIGLEWWFFAVAGGLALLIALCTVSFQSIQAARANPSKALRSE